MKLFSNLTDKAKRTIAVIVISIVSYGLVYIVGNQDPELTNTTYATQEALQLLSTATMAIDTSLPSTPIAGIRDLAGNSLDGDFDGEPGGNFVYHFTIGRDYGSSQYPWPDNMKVTVIDANIGVNVLYRGVDAKNNPKKLSIRRIPSLYSYSIGDLYPSCDNVPLEYDRWGMCAEDDVFISLVVYVDWSEDRPLDAGYWGEMGGAWILLCQESPQTCYTDWLPTP